MKGYLPLEPKEESRCKLCACIEIEEDLIENIPLQRLNQIEELRMDDFYASDQDNSFHPKPQFDVLEDVIRDSINESRSAERSSSLSAL